MNLFQFSKEQKPSSESILNVGLKMAMDFGKNWLSPIDERIKEKYQDISIEEARALNDLCKRIMDEANEWVCRTADKYPGKKLDREAFATHMLAVDSRINKETLSRLMGQAMYYASKDGYKFK